MDLLDSLQALAARARHQSERLQTVEAVKTALVLPFLRALGYDVFDPDQVTPGPTGEGGLSQGERVDLLLRSHGRPVILLECLPFGQELGEPISTNLFWRFPTAEVRLGVLTNGTCYRFFADLDQPGVLDDQPFFEFEVLSFRERDLGELKRFSPEALDIDAILVTAAEGKISRRVTRLVAEQMTHPSPELLQTLANLAQAGPLQDGTQIEAFGHLVRRSFQQVVTDRIHDRLMASIALNEPSEMASEIPFMPTQQLEPLLELPEPLAAGPLTAPDPFLTQLTVEEVESGAAIPVPACIQETARTQPGRSRALVFGLALGLVALGGFAWTHFHQSAPAATSPERGNPVLASAAGFEDLRNPEPTTPTLLGAVESGNLEEASRLTESRGASLPPDHWTLRLAIAHEPPTVRNLLASLKGQEQEVFLRPIQMLDGRGCYQVFLGNFPDEASARQAALRLPAGVTDGGKAPKLFKAGEIPSRQEK